MASSSFSIRKRKPKGKILRMLSNLNLSRLMIFLTTMKIYTVSTLEIIVL